MDRERVLRITRPIDALSLWTGRLVSLLILPLVFGLTYEVVSRYGFDQPTFWAYDTAYMLYGSHFMLGAAYTLLKGGHIRTDIFYQNWSVQRRGLIDAALYIFLFFPGMIFFLWMGWIEAHHAWVIQERAETTAWRPYIWPMKMAIPLAAILLMIQGVSELLKSLYAGLTGRPL